MRLPCLATLAVALGLSGCAASSGTAAHGFSSDAVAASYIPLHSSSLLGSGDAAAVAIAPGIAVTNAHNANLIDPKTVIGTSSGYDLLFFRTSVSATLQMSSAKDGEEVIAYGQGKDGDLRIAHGVVNRFWPAAFGYVADAGPGFSGGPVLDAKSGALLGITYGYQDERGQRLMVAYSAAFVTSQLAAVQAPPQRNNR